MSNTPKTDLHALIQSLSRTEKRYVKTYLLRHRDAPDTQTALLFDAVEAQAEYDEAAIRKRYAKQPFIRRLPEAKRELHRIILRAMREYKNESTSQRKIMAALQDVQFLLEHNLPRQADKRLEDAEALITRTEDHALSMIAMRFRQRLDRLNRGPIHGGDLTALSEALTSTAARIKEDTDVMTLSMRVSAMVLEAGHAFGRADTKPDPAITSAIAHWEQHPPKSTRAYVDLLDTIAEWSYYMLGDKKRARKIDEQLLDIYNTHPVYEDRRVLERSSHLYAMTQRVIGEGDFDTARELVQRLRDEFRSAAPKKGTSLWRQLLLRIVSSELLIHLAAGTLEEPSSRLRELTQEVEALEKIRPTVFGLISFFNLAIVAFFTGKNRDATRLLHRAMEYGTDRRTDIYMGSRMMLLMIHAEQDHWSLVASMARSIKRSLPQFGKATPDELALLSCMTRLAEFPTPRKRMIILRETLQVLLTTRAQQGANLRTDMYAFQAWLIHQIEKRPLLATLREMP